MLDPDQLKDTYEKVKMISEMKNECDALKASMEEYEGLPPNIEQAKQVLAQTIQEYKDMDKHLKSQILEQKKRASIMMSVPEEHPAWRLK